MATTTIPYDPYTQGLQQGQYHQGLLAGYPGGNIIQQQMTGYLPADVLTNIYQQGAERGVVSGMPGSSGTNAATMRALGLTSVDLQQKGLENALKLYSTAPQDKISEGIVLNTGPKDTAVPLGPGSSSALSSTRGAGTGRAAAEPAAPGEGYNAFLSDWMNRYGVSSVRGGATPSTGGSLQERQTATPGASPITMSGPGFMDSFWSDWENSFGTPEANYYAPLQQYLDQYSGSENTAPLDTGTYAEYPDLDPMGFSTDYRPAEAQWNDFDYWGDY